MRESNIGHDLKEMAQEVVRFGERCVHAGREWLNERRDDMNNRNEGGRRDYSASGHRQEERDSQRPYGQQEFSQSADRSRAHSLGPGQAGGRGEYYGGTQFDERMQRAGWQDERNWEYEGGPERYGTSGYGETDQQGYRQNQRTGRQYGSQYAGQREHGQHSGAGSDYYSGREGFAARGDFGGDYSTHGRSQGYGQGSGYTRATSRDFAGRQAYGSSSTYGGGSSAPGGRGAVHASPDYVDDGEMSGYGGRELSSQQVGSSSSGRYGTAPGQYGYGGYGGSARSYRGVGPKNYMRSDERLTEEINERLTDDDDLDASELMVRVVGGKATLEGSVDQRWMKHRAEDIAGACIGVKEIDNRIVVGGSVGSGLDSSTGESRGAASRTTSDSGVGGRTGGSSTPH